MAKKEQNKTLHSRNLHNSRYDFEVLIQSEPSLNEFVKPNKYGDLSIDFSNSDAVLALNKALLAHFYSIKNWKIPQGYLCPPIPGRADYVHYIADLLANSNDGKIPTGKKIKGLDIGVGANGIYPIIANSVYSWSFVGSDIDKVSIENVESILKDNPQLENISLSMQNSKKDIFKNIIGQDDYFDFTLCNPPFHKSKDEAQKGTNRKIRNLTKKETKSVALNFGGKSNELWCKGGEVAFIKKMITQSKDYAKNIFWFTSLVSKKENLELIYKALKNVHPVEVKTIEMKQGQKLTRFIAWTFLSTQEQAVWVKKHWMA